MSKIGIIIAMDEELEQILHICDDIVKVEKRGIEFIDAQIKGKNCIIAKSGVGKVNAARTTQVMIYEFNPEYIINVGVAGGLNESLDIGDVIIAKSVVQHDFDITAFGHSKGYVPGIGNNIVCNESLLNKIQDMLDKTYEREYLVKLGIVATGDIFCTEIWMKNKIFAKFKADVVDMECAAVAQICYLEKIPFIAIRSISDIPNKKNVETYENNLKLAAKRCSNVLREFLNK